jgi:hypothetical protein
VNKCATDLVRLAAKFGRNLLAYPESIYYLIIPFRPRDSAVNQGFADPHSSLTAAGLDNDALEESISYINFRDNRAMPVAAGDNTFTIGTKSGRIYLYWQTISQERMNLEHGESAKTLRFDNSHRLASAGPYKFIYGTLTASP